MGGVGGRDRGNHADGRESRGRNQGQGGESFHDSIMPTTPAGLLVSEIIAHAGSHFREGRQLCCRGVIDEKLSDVLDM